MTVSLGMPLTESDNDFTRDDKNITLDLDDRVSFNDFIEKPLSDEIIFPAELNAFLQDRIRDLQSENGLLRREFDETKDAFEKLQRSSEFLKEKTSKVEEWSKKYRHQTAEFEVLKTKFKKLEEKLSIKENELENEKQKNNELQQNKNNSINISEEETLDFHSEISKKEEQVKSLTEKLQQTNAKLYETKNTCTTLKQEVNKALKLLSREIGENVTISSLSNRPSGWKGRAEQVQHLQQKVSELQSKLSEYDDSFSSKSNFTVSSEQRNISYLRNLEKERRIQIENSARELKQAEVALEDSKKKFQGARARIKILENELGDAKTYVMLLKEKSIHDDQLIEALRGELRAVEDRFRDRANESRYQKEKAQETCNDLRIELGNVRMQVELLRKKLEEREIEIEKLRDNTERHNPERFWQTPIKSSRTTPISTPRNPKDPNEYVTLSIAAEAERQRLFELVTLLNRRVDKEIAETDHINTLLRQERNKNAKLETKLQRLEMERISMSKINTGYKAKCSKSFNLASKENINAEKIQFKLELLEEERLALKTRLATVQKDKANDLEIYKRMLEQARRTFQDAFRGKMSYTAGCHSNVTI